MESPFVRAKARDSVDALDGLTAYFVKQPRDEIVEFVGETFQNIERVMARALEVGNDPVDAYRAFVSKFHKYWNAPPALRSSGVRFRGCCCRIGAASSSF